MSKIGPMSHHAKVEVPVIETSRLKLRGHQVDDFAALAAMWAEPEVVRHITGTPSTEQQSWARLLNYAGHWTLMGFGYWAVEDKATGLYAGDLGFADFKRVIEPSIRGTPELGWVLAPRFQGKGYATEAVRAATAWADATFTGGRTVCMISPENLASIRVAEKGGFKEFARTTYVGSPTIMYERFAARA